MNNQSHQTQAIMLSKRQRLALISLESNPQMTYKELGSILDVNPITAKRTVEDLYAQNIIGKTRCIYHKDALGMQLFSLIAYVKSIKQIKILEKKR